MRKFSRILISLFFFLLLTLNISAQANHVVISEVAPMGGSSSVYDTGEFIELYNPLPADVTFGENVVLTSGEANGTNHAAWTISLTGKTIKAYGFYLIGDAGVAVTPDLAFPDSKNLANSGTRSYVQLKDGESVIDAFGWDPANVTDPSCEGTAFTPSNTTSTDKSFQRKSGALATANDDLGDAWDTGDNSADFFENTSAESNPQNYSSEIEINPYNISSTNGPGAVSVLPAVWKYDASTTLTFTVQANNDTVTDVKIIKPETFSWVATSFSVTPDSVTISQSGDTTAFTNFYITGTESITIAIDAVTATDSTDEFKIEVLTSSDGISFNPVQDELSTIVYGSPRSAESVKVKESNGVQTYIGKYVVTKGVATVANEFGGPSYLQDNTAGFAVYDQAVSTGISIGDDVTVLGKVSSYNELFEITPVLVWEKNAENVAFDTLTLTIPQVLTQNQSGREPYESKLIRINNIQKVLTTNGAAASAWTVTGSGTNYDLVSGNDTLEIRIDADIDLINLAIPSGSFSVVGVLGQYKDFYQIMPRSQADIIPESGGPQIVSSPPYESDITSSSITFNYTTSFAGSSIINYGKTTDYGNYASDETSVTDHEITVPGLSPSTIYHVRIGSAYNGDTTFTHDYIVETASSNSSGIMNVYFSQSVDTSVSLGEDAQKVNISQKFISRVNSAEYSIDAALYSLSGTVGANIANALISAKNRGVKVRVIGEYDNRGTAPWTTLSNGGITVIFDNYDATNGGDGLMHNKFAVIDNRDTSGTNDWVWCGSWNATDPGTNDDAQNVIEIQDKSLANAYTVEFEEMWGSSTETPDASKSRFGARKTDNTPHLFNIAGTKVEVYFDPSDNTTLKIGNELEKAVSSINIAMLSFTRDDLADILISEKNSGKKVRVLLDNNSDSGNEYSNLQSNGIDIHLKGDALKGFLHHKYAIVDADNITADPTVITGSHNWSSSAENYNNENTVIVHNSRIANLFYQEFKSRYIEAGGTDIITGIEENQEIPADYSLNQNYPNPFNPSTTIVYSIPQSGYVSLKVFNMLGQEVRTLVNEEKPSGTFRVTFNASGLSTGIYFYEIKAGNFYQVNKMLLIK